MITKREILVRMGILLTCKEVIEDIEKYIVRAAGEGKRSVTYKFPERADKVIVDEVYEELIKAGYTTSGKVSTFNNPLRHDPYKEVVIGW